MSRQKNTEKNAICFVGTLVSEKWFDEISARSRVKASGSPLYLQEQIYESLVSEGANVEVFSYPPVAAIPGSKLFATFAHKQSLKNGLPVHIISIINVPFLKQMTVFVSMFFNIFLWSTRNRSVQKTIITYADFLEYCMPAILVAKLFHAKTILFLTEMPGYAHYLNRKPTLKDRIIIESEIKKRKMHSKFDGYIFISEKLAEAVNKKKKPYTVVEGFANAHIFDGMSETEKNGKFVFMYAGSLGGQYNIPALMDGFSMVKVDCELWVYGTGTYEDYVKKAAENDRRILYFGRVPRDEILRAEKKTQILLHTKTEQDEFTKYCFSSKIMEYMLSGTPMLTTRVGGIPEEYYNYAFIIEEPTAEGICQAMENVMHYDEEDMRRKGQQAYQFVIDQKSLSKQGEKILRLVALLHKKNK